MVKPGRRAPGCWCGYGPWHHAGHPYPPYYPPPGFYCAPPQRRSAGRAVDAEELADYLRDLEEQIARVRRDLDEIRRPSGAAER